MMGSPKQRFQFYLSSAITTMLVASVLVGLAVAVVLWFRSPSRQTRITVQNRSEKVLTSVSIQWSMYGNSSIGGASALEKLDSGDECVIAVPGDVAVSLSYSIEGETRFHTQSYVDLWTGELYVFRIQPDGSVTANYSTNLP
jgi:hypothetical protein